MPDPEPKDLVIIAVNRRARHEFAISAVIEAGIELKGSEVKALRERNANLKEGFAHIRNQECFLEGVHIRPYSHTSDSKLNPTRSRRLLLHRNQIRRLATATQKEGLTLVPLRLFFRKGWAKVEIGLGKGKKLHDKRDSLRKKEAKRDMAQAIKKSLKS